MKTFFKLALTVLAAAFPLLLLAEMSGFPLLTELGSEAAIATFATVGLLLVTSQDYANQGRRALRVATLS